MAAQPATGARADSAGASTGAPVYRVAKGDYLGGVADRYLDDFDDYHRLAALNKLRNPDRIRPGQLIKLPEEAHDQGSRQHATGRLVAPKPRPVPGPERTEQTRPTPTNPGDAVERPGEAVARRPDRATGVRHDSAGRSGGTTAGAAAERDAGGSLAGGDGGRVPGRRARPGEPSTRRVRRAGCGQHRRRADRCGARPAPPTGRLPRRHPPPAAGQSSSRAARRPTP